MGHEEERTSTVRTALVCSTTPTNCISNRQIKMPSPVFSLTSGLPTPLSSLFFHIVLELVSVDEASEVWASWFIVTRSMLHGSHRATTAIRDERRHASECHDPHRAGVEYLNSRRPSSIEALSYRSERFLSVPSGPASLARSNSSRGANSRNGSRGGSEASTRRMSSTSLTSRFKYSPLDPKVRRAIRVISIRPHLQDGMISCDIEHATTKSSYRAVSYTWGNPDDPHEPILISGCPFTVRRNLHRFLSHARKEYPDRALWIDALCINQDDKQERARQVEIMSKIYSNTKEVLVWLGPRLDYAGHTIRRMQAYERMSDTDMALSSSKDNDFWKGFKAINSARYWDRVWCVQEFVQPPNGKNHSRQ